MRAIGLNYELSEPTIEIAEIGSNSFRTFAQTRLATKGLHSAENAQGEFYGRSISRFEDVVSIPWYSARKGQAREISRDGPTVEEHAQLNFFARCMFDEVLAHVLDVSLGDVEAFIRRTLNDPDPWVLQPAE